VFVIIAILGTISFLAYTSYAKDARDTVRLSDLNSIEKFLQLVKVNSTEYPSPTNSINISYSGATLWSQ